MEASSQVFTAIIPIFLVMVAGFFARRIGWLKEEADSSLMRVVVNLLYPCLIFSFVLGNDALKQIENLILPPLIGSTTVVAGFAIGMLAARYFKLGDSRECRTFGFSTGLYNYGYFAIPVVAILFDRETVGVLVVHNLGVEFAMWALGVGFILSSGGSKSVWRRVLTAPVMAILIAVPLNFFGADRLMPEFSFELLDLLGRCAIPLGLILIGATFADLVKEQSAEPRWNIHIAACVLRLGVLPVIFLAIAFLFPLPQELRAVIVVQAAMPGAVFPIVLSRHYGGSPEIALKVVLSTTVLSIITIPIWITIGLSLLN